MNAQQLDQALLALCVPTIAPGPHMRALAERLSPRWRPVSRGGPSRRRRAAFFVGLATASLLAAAAGTYTYYRHGIVTTYRWVESESSVAQAFADEDPAHRDEIIALWTSGQVTLLEKRPDTPYRSSSYVVRFDFQDGTSATLDMKEHPSPAARAEWRQLRDAGGGEVVSLQRLRNAEVTYVVRYVLSSGETIQRLDSYPAMSKADRCAAQDYVIEQVKSGAGTIVGCTGTGVLVVEFTLPDGSPFTSYEEQPYPRPQLTPARQDEIFQMAALGQGNLKRQLFSEQVSTYVVEYTLADGSVFEIGTWRPIMTDAQWDAARAEAEALYAAGQYTRETVTAVDGRPVEVLVMTLSTGYIAKIRDVAETRRLWGIE